ncbi:MAG TPA: DNA polymerase I [Burkholderiales bacterium]|nr:DNA polymerase I [Burkholderiales bacterium]
MKTLLLVDGSSYLYRAFHALPDLRNSRNEPTGAIYGVLNMLRRLSNEVRADYSACVFDAKGKTFRDDWYPQYKANRPAMPDDLVAQIEPLHLAVKAFGWPLLMIDGVEADDVIGTLAAYATKHDLDTIISTGDKDIAQLVNERVTLVNTMTNEKLDLAGVVSKFGVTPDRIVDYLTLVGDTVDNVPGVEKVGPKTAVKWLAEHGSLENVIANAGKIGGVVGENLRKALDWLPQGRRLVTIKCDVDLPFTLEELRHREPDNAKLAELFERFQFKTWLKEIQGAAAPGDSDGSPALTSSPAPKREYETIFTHEQLDLWLAKIQAADLVCIDTETTSLDQHAARIVGISFSCEPGKAAYLPLTHRYAGAPDQISLDTALVKLKPWLEDETRAKLGQNAKYDIHVFANHGVAMRGVIHDTLLQSYVTESHRPHDMDSMALRHLDVATIKFEDVAGKGANQICFDQVDIERATEYSAEDADITLQLHHALYPSIAKDDKLELVYRQIEMPVMSVLFRMERNGVLIDAALLEAQSRELGQKMFDLERRAHEQAGQPFNLNSPKQIQEILFERQKLPVKKKTPSGTPSTDEDVLAELALDYPLPKLLLEYRGLAKLKSTYTDKLPRMINQATGRVHTNYGQAVAVTGRLSSNDPNLQNIPVRNAEGRRIREAFIAPAGSKIISADYSQIELRIMAHLSEDEGLLAAFAAGEDVHRATAAEIFSVEREAVSSEQRRYAKVINFGLIYGMSAFGLAANLGIERAAAQAYIERYFARYPGVKAYMDTTRELARERGYVETVFGRRLYLPEIRASNAGRRQGAERAAINAPMQGTAADLIKLAMIEVDRWLTEQQLKSKLVMQVHDELVLETPEDELSLVREKLPGLMTNIGNLRVPLLVEVGVGRNWEEAH